jgi:hypothetical protein
MNLRELAIARLAELEKQREEAAEKCCPVSGRLRVSGPDKTPQSHISLGIEAVRTPLAVRTRISSPDNLSGPDKCGQSGQPDSPDTSDRSDNPDKSDGLEERLLAARLAEAERDNLRLKRQGSTLRFCQCGEFATRAWPHAHGREIWFCLECEPAEGVA